MAPPHSDNGNLVSDFVGGGWNCRRFHLIAIRRYETWLVNALGRGGPRLPDPDAIAPFWAEATGWPVLGSDGVHVWLRDTAANGPLPRHPRQRQPQDHQTPRPPRRRPTSPTIRTPRSLGSSRWEPARSTSARMPGVERLTWNVLADPPEQRALLAQPALAAAFGDEPVGELDAAAEPELAVHPSEVRFDRLGSQEDLRGDLPRGRA
jgi:hypothetical protein